MTRARDTYEMFFDDEAELARREQKSFERAGYQRRARVTGASDLIDLDLIHHTDAGKGKKAIKVSYGDIGKAVWLPRSLIKIEETGEVRRIYAGRFDQKVRVTMPEWLAKEKGLIS